MPHPGSQRNPDDAPPGQPRVAIPGSRTGTPPRGGNADGALLTGTIGDAHAAAKRVQVHPKASRRHDDARYATASAASSLHRIQVSHEAAGHHSRTAASQGDGTLTPHAA